jgi:hypothetical protein
MAGCKIDDEFIAKWHSKYDCTEDDEGEYQALIRIVAAECRASRTISRDTLVKIFDWKSPRPKGKVKWDEYERYEAGFKQAFESSKIEERVACLISLPGIGIPVASTILSMMFPDEMPIIDVRTVAVLYSKGCLCRSRAQEAIKNIRRNCKRPWTLREIDRALFAYHKSGVIQAD